MAVSRVPRTILSLVQPSVQVVAGRLFVLTTGRPGSDKYQPTISTFYETGLVTALYEQLLMSPVFANYEIRHEMPYHGTGGAPERVDLWMRPVKGGYPHLVEAGDYSKGKVESDAAKMRRLNTTGANWFLAFFRGPRNSIRPFETIHESINRANGLDQNLVEVEEQLTTSFQVYRPDGNHDPFGAALIRVR